MEYWFSIDSDADSYVSPDFVGSKIMDDTKTRNKAEANTRENNYLTPR